MFVVGYIIRVSYTKLLSGLNVLMVLVVVPPTDSSTVPTLPSLNVILNLKTVSLTARPSIV